MRVLALLPNAYHDGGGIAQYNRDWLLAVSSVKAVSEIHLCCLGTGSADAQDKMPEKISGMQTRQSKWRFALAAIQEVRHFEPDIIFCGHFGLLKLVRWLPKKQHWKLWLQLHGIEAWPLASRNMRTIAAKADFVTCVSRFTRSKALAWLNIAPEKIRVLPNTVHENFSPGEKKNLTLQTADKKILLTVGRLSAAERYKGQDKVIAALPEIIKKQPNILYLIAGSGDDEERLRQLAQHYLVQDHVKFLGHIIETDLPDVFRLADLYVMPSTGEGFGIAYLEAMACGTPALGLNVDGSVDPLADGELGMVIDPKQSLAEYILQALENPGDKNRLSRAVNQRFGRKVFNQQVAYYFDNHGAALGGP